MADLSVESTNRQSPSSQDQSTPLLTSLQKRSFVGEKARSTSLSSRKLSTMAQKSHLRLLSSTTPSSLTPYTPPPILSPKRSGSGLYCQLIQNEDKEESSSTRVKCLDSPVEGEVMDMKIKIDEDDGLLNGIKNGGRPHRKNGLFYTANDELDLEALRKDSWASSSSNKSTQNERKVSWFGTSSSHQSDSMRKASSVSDCYYECIYNPQQSDPNPHINIGREYQARVKKWSDREILPEERDSIPDRDERVFDCKIIDHLSEEQMTAYEYLACSKAVPRPGRNKELALHLLMENKGNMEAAVMDLLRSDTLDWEQYPIIYNSIYNDSTQWSPDQINSFQDALYKSEKDFHQVSQEISLPVKVCVEWYYTWKKALPDDYRKLRNLRRKRRLLEAQMGVEQQQMILMGKAVQKSSRLEEEDDDGLDEASSMDPLSNCTVSDIMSQVGSSSSTLPSSLFPNTAFHMGALQEGRPRLGSFSGGLSGLSPIHKTSGSMYPQSISPCMSGDMATMNKYQPSNLRQSNPSTSKKGAQPSADGMFHCRLCDKCFEKVKSLNAHMKSHAMKARAEAEARAQVQMISCTSSHQSISSSPLPYPAHQSISPPLPYPSYQSISSPLPYPVSPLMNPSSSPSLHLPFIFNVPSVSSSSLSSSVLQSSLQPPPPSLNVDAQLQQLGLASHLLGLNQMHNLTGSSPLQGNTLPGLHIAPSLGIH